MGQVMKLPIALKDKCGKYGMYLREIQLTQPDKIESDAKSLTNWLSAYRQLIEACSFLPNLSALSLQGDFLPSDRGYMFVKALLTGRKRLRKLDLYFGQHEPKVEVTRKYLELIVSEVPSLRHLELSSGSHYGEVPFPSFASLAALFTLLRELPELRRLRVFSSWCRQDILRHLGTLPDLLRLAFSYTWGSQSTVESSGKRNEKGVFPCLQNLTLPLSIPVVACEHINHFPVNHPLETLELNSAISSDLAEKILHRFTDLRYLHAESDKGITGIQFTRGGGFTPLKAYNLVGLCIRDVILADEDLNDVLGSWPNLEYLSLVGPDIAFLLETEEFNPGGDNEAFVTDEPVGPTLQVLGMIARHQRKLKRLDITVGCHDTSSLQNLLKSTMKFPNSLEYFHLPNSFYNCQFETFHVCDAADYIAALGPPGSDLGLQVGWKKPVDFEYFYPDGFGELGVWYALLCERLERRILEVRMKEVCECSNFSRITQKLNDAA